MRISDWSSDVCSSDLTATFSFAAVTLVAAMAPAMLAVMALASARQAGSSPALTWWAASLGTEALRLSALAAASIFDPTCFLAVHEGGQAIDRKSTRLNSSH